MTYTLTLNPLIFVQFAAVAQTAIMAIIVAAPKDAKPLSRQAAATLDFFKVFGYCAASVFAVLFVDTGIAWLAGAWGYADWKYQLPSALLLVVVGVEYLVAGLLKRGSWVSVAYIAGIAATLLLFLHGWVPSFVVMGPTLEGVLPVILGALVGAGALVAGIEAGRLGRLHERKWRGTWDVSPVVDRIFNKWTNLVIWILAVAQGILIFSGYSLLTFWVP